MPKKKTQDVAERRPTAARRVKTPRVLTQSEIANRAYQLFVERGGEHGRDQEDWLLAERALRS